MKTDNNYVRSGRERLVDDNYQTIDPRCILALTSLIKITNAVDVCSPNGSGIVDELQEKGIPACGISDAFEEIVSGDWIVTNPPYQRSIVDKIVNRQIERVESGQVKGLAILVRTQFDHAKTRWGMFAANTSYAGQIKMLFRPKWFEDGESTPIHNYVWHIWGEYKIVGYPARIWYWKEH